MEKLLEYSTRVISFISMDFSRFLMEEIKWEHRLIGIKGARGVGKTTLALQRMKLTGLSNQQAAYFTLDDLYFTNHTLRDVVDLFYKSGGELVVLDEVHKYPNWSIEIKNLTDYYPDLRIIFTGSSIIDIAQQEGDLSRRALIYELPGLSFREYLAFKKVAKLEKIKLDDLVQHSNEIASKFPSDFRPLAHFKDYLTHGYYPFGIAMPDILYQQINQLIRTIVEIDMVSMKEFDIRNAHKMLQLIGLIAQQVPFKPNISAIAAKTKIHRNTLPGYLYFLERAKIISLLMPAGSSVSTLQKPEKIYLSNTTLAYALSFGNVEIGSIRETFFLSQVKPFYEVKMPLKGDFIINNTYSFEIGGKSKSRKQIDGVAEAYVVKDDLEYPVGSTIPLWMFGLLY